MTALSYGGAPCQDWDELGDKYENSKTVLIGDVDCTVEASKALCEEQGVKGYPTLMVYPPGETTGESYEGGRDLEALKKFAKTLGPSCSPKHLKKCSEEQKATLEGYMAMSAEALGAQMGEMEGRLSEASATHDALLKELQARFEESDKALKALKEELEPSLKLMKAVRRDTAPVEPAPKEEV